MFTPAEWEDDVPESVADFKTINRKKKAKPENKTVRAGGVQKKKIDIKNRDKQKELKIKNHDKKKENLVNNKKVEFKKSDSNINKNNDQRETPRVEVKSNNVQNSPGSNKMKRKRNNNRVDINIDEDIDEKIILDKKREMYGDDKQADVEQMLFKVKQKKNQKLDKHALLLRIDPKKKAKSENKIVKAGGVQKEKIDFKSRDKQNELIIKNNYKKKEKPVNNKKIQLKQGNSNINKNNDQRETPRIEVKSNNVQNSPGSNKIKRKRNNNRIDINIDEDIDEKIILDKKKEMYGENKPADIEKMLFKVKQKKKQKLKNLLDSHLDRRVLKPTSGSSLRERMLQRLRAARFRYLNEKLYLSESKDAMKLFEKDPESFQVYHDGFRQQVRKWPINPVEVVIKSISRMPKNVKVADMGCGEAMLAKLVPQDVRSFDLVSMVEGVEVCDMAHTPLKKAEMDVAVYCLALMGTNMKDYFIEANRILKVGGLMKIAEVESRFKDVKNFIKTVESYGFSLSNFDDSRQVFFFFDFRKERDLGNKSKMLPNITLDPCLYKKR